MMAMVLVIEVMVVAYLVGAVIFGMVKAHFAKNFNITAIPMNVELFAKRIGWWWLF